MHHADWPLLRSGLDDLAWPAIPAREALGPLALQAQFEQTQWWDPERIAVQQRRQLERLVRHAAAHVPYYAKRMRRWGIDPSAPLTDAVWQRIPILGRAELQRAGDAIHATKVPPSHGRTGVVATSGSSGRPVTVRKTELSLMFWQAVTLRDHLWHRRDLSAKSCQIRDLPAGTGLPPTGSHTDGWGPATDGLFHAGPSTAMSVSVSVEVLAAWVVQQRPRYLLAYPSVVRGLLDHWASTGTAPRGIDQVRTISEMVRPGLRERVRAELGADLVDMYSSAEVGYVGLQCPEHPHYHTQDETIRVEVLREDGTPCAPGEVGRVVVTPLHHFATPLLRYEVGDGARVGEACPCGRGLGTITEVLGRIRHMLRYPDGRRVWPVFGVVGFSKLAPIRQWRVVQTALDHLEIHLAADRPLTDEERSRVAASICDALGHPFRTEIVEHADGIARGAAGKYEDFVCAIDAP